MALSVRQHNTTAETATGTQTCAFSSAVLAGSLLVVGFTAFPTSSTIVQISDNVNGSWTSGITQNLNSTQCLGGIYYFPNSSSGTITVTVHVTGSFTSMCIAEITGAATTSPVDVTAGSTSVGAVTNPQTNAFSTLNANDILLAYAYQQDANATYAARGSYTLTDSNAANGSGQGMEYLIVSSTQTSVTAGFTSSGSVDSGVVMVAFKAVGGVLHTQSFAAATAAFAATLAKQTAINLTAAMASFSATVRKKTILAIAAATSAFAATLTGARIIVAMFNASTTAFAAQLNKKTATFLSAATASFSAVVRKTTAVGGSLRAALSSFIASLSTNHITFTPDYNQRLMLSIIAKIQSQGIHISSSTLISTVCTFREGRGFNFPWVEAYDIGTVTADWLALEASGLVPPNIVTED